MSDLQRIMASLDAQRRTTPPEPAPVSPTEPAAATPADDDAGEIGSVAAAALRAYRQGASAPRSNAPSGPGARLLAAEAERIAAERRGEAPPSEVASPSSDATAGDEPPGGMLLSSPAPAGEEPYVYGAGAFATPEPAIAAALEADPVREEEAIEDFVPQRHRPVEAAPQPVSRPAARTGDFPFDINAFVEELEREAARAGREWSEQDGEALFAGGRTPLGSDKAPSSIGSWELSTAEPAAATVAPPRRHLLTDSFTWKRFALLGLFVAGAVGAGVTLQSLAARNDTGAVEAAENAAVDSVAPQPDQAVETQVREIEVQPQAQQAQAEASAQAPAESQVALRGTSGPESAPAQPAPAVRDVTPGIADRVPQGSPTPGDGAAAAGQSGGQPMDQPMDQVLPGEGRDVSSVAAPGNEAPAAAAADAGQAEGQAPAAQLPEVAASEVQASDARASETEASDAQAAEAPASAAPAAPLPKPSPLARPTLAAAAPVARTAPDQAPAPVEVAATAEAPATTQAPPSGTATIKSGVTLRAGPDNKAAALGTLKAGQNVDLVACKMWCEVVADGRRGFVFKKFVEAGAPAQ